MLRPLLFVAVVLPLLGCPVEVLAQFRRGNLVSQVTANRFALQRAWFTRVRVNPARGQIAHLRQHVSSTRAYTVHEINYDGGRLSFSERDLDRFGAPLGKQAAQTLAEQNIEDLKRAGLNPTLNSHNLPEITLFVVTNRGVVQAIDVHTGRTRWTMPVGDPFYHNEALGANDDYLAVVNGSTIYLLDQVTGKLVWQRQARGAPGAGPAVSDYAVFVPMLNGTVEAYQLADPTKRPYMIQSHSTTRVQPIYTGNRIAWPTERGSLYVAESDRDAVLFRLETNNRIVAQAAALAPGRIVVASTDGYLYCVHEATGHLHWRFSTGEPISNSPLVVEDAIYVVTDDYNLFRLAAEQGALQWRVSGVRSFVASSGKRLYCRGTTNRLLILDTASGAAQGSLPVETLDLDMVNHRTDRIILGSQRGTIQCLHELEHQFPLVHAGVLEEKQAEPAEVEDAAQPKPQTTEAPSPFGGSTDPFGGGGDSGDTTGAESPDPFGGGGTDPFGGSGGDAGDDPFGGDSGGSSGGSGNDDPFGSSQDPFGGF